MNVLALHGFTGAPESFEELASLVPSVPLLRPALSGHGPHPDTSARDFDAEVQRLATWLGARAQEPVVALGYSLGARVALGLCLAHPETFSSAVLVGVNPGIPQAGLSERVAWEEGWVTLLEEHGIQAFLEQWERLPLFSTQRTLDGERRDTQRRIRQRHQASGLAHALRALGTGRMPDLTGQLERLELPVTLIVGEHDEKFIALAELALARLPRGRLVVAPGCGHNVLLESPHTVAAELARHLESFPSPPRRP